MTLNQLSDSIHQAHIKWWQDIKTGEPLKRNRGELLALVHSEISEGEEGAAGNLKDDKLTHRPMCEVELADAYIRLFDYAGGFGYDLDHAAQLKGISEFIDLNHFPRCAAAEELIAQLNLRGIAYIHTLISRVVEHERKSRVGEVPEALLNVLLAIGLYGIQEEYDLQGAVDEKLAFNAVRKDHTHEARLAADGKKF